MAPSGECLKALSQERLSASTKWGIYKYTVDIKTTKGKETVIQELECVELFESLNTEFKYVHTDKNKPIPFDGLLLKNSQLYAIVETKCRIVSEERFRNEFNNEWLITFDKLLNCANASKSLQVPLVGFLYLVPDKVLLIKRLTDDNGQFVCQFRCQNTKTQATVNGGEANRLNAFVDMTNAKRLP